ncbi:hypothetical protein P8452_68441 [Trifolium repens]|nr:hypothetical protein P8452_68441 [Trifolium repens]
MAVQIPYGVATSLINRLASAALREYGRINGVMDELERLKNTIEFIRVVLLDAEEKQEQNHAVQNWIKRLKDILIPADDLLDEFVIQDMIQKRDEPHQNKVTKIRDKTPVGFGKLSIQQHGGVIFSKWLSPLTNIIEISLTFCEGVQFLPPMERLPFLKSLRLMDMIALEYIYYEELILHEPFFPSLKRLDIRYCNKLVGWKSMRDDFNDINTSSHHLLLTPFRCLSFLEINQCPMLTHMPTCPTIKKLALEVLPVEKLLYHVYASQYSISCNPLSMLQSLQIQETIMDVKNVPQYWWQNLTSLENLEFRCLSSEHFQAIEIWFKGDINYLPSLQKITFERCLSLKALPDWICNISSLQHIKVEGCHELALLPEGMPRLTNLHSLKIIGNVDSLLIEECQKETSATWSKIAHIPNIIIIPILQRVDENVSSCVIV